MYFALFISRTQQIFSDSLGWEKPCPVDNAQRVEKAELGNF